MLLYVLPFVILLVVALILKKREASKDAEPSKKSTPIKSKAKPVSTSSSEVSTSTPNAPATLVALPKSELAPELRRHIESQIRDGNYFAAEAQINQALNRDNGQHELYLMLLDLHLIQNDEFAINQLFTHLRSLQLDDVLRKAQQKRETHEQALAQEAKAKADAQAAQRAASAISFDQLQEQATQTQSQAPLEFTQENTSNATTHAAQPAQKSDDIKPLEFSFSPAQAAPKATQSLEAVVPTAKTVPQTEQKPLDFSFTATPPQVAQPNEVASNAQTRPSLDFNFSATAPESKSVEAQAEPSTVEHAKALDFSFSAAKQETVKAQPEFEFNLEAPAAKPTTPTVQPTTQNFEFQVQPQQTEPVVVAKVAPVEVETKTQAGPDQLLQLFPVLEQVDEIDLNVRLAAEYIRLGAYADAKALLAEHEHSYNDQQRQIVTALRNKIA